MNLLGCVGDTRELVHSMWRLKGSVEVVRSQRAFLPWGSAGCVLQGEQQGELDLCQEGNSGSSTGHSAELAKGLLHGRDCGVERGRGRLDRACSSLEGRESPAWCLGVGGGRGSLSEMGVLKEEQVWGQENRVGLFIIFLRMYLMNRNF